MNFTSCQIIITLLFCIIPFTIIAESEEEFRRAIELFDNNEHSEARQILENYVRDNSRNADAWFYLGRIAQAENRLSDADDYLKKAIKLDESRSSYHQWLGRVYGMRAMDASVFRQPFLARNSRRSFETAVELDPDNIEARFDLLQFYVIAPGVVGGSTSKAFEQAEEIKNRNKAQGHIAYGFIYNRESDFEKAEPEFIAARDLDPANPDPYYSLAFLYVRTENYIAALDELDRLIEISPELMSAYYQYGRVVSLSGERLERGKEYLKKYLDHSPGLNEPPHAWTHYRLGMLFEIENDRDRAHSHYEIALQLDPDHEQAKEALRKLNSN